MAENMWNELDGYRGSLIKGEWPTIPQLFKIAVDRFGSNPAFVVYEPDRKEMTYNEAYRKILQGAAFLHGGEEMLRTKVMEPGDPYWDKIEENDYVSLPGTENRLIRNSYCYGDAVNAFQWDRKALYKDFYEKYREAVHARRELIEEGFVREIVSKVQTMRKEAGFEVLDRIAVYHKDSDKVAGVIERNKERIMGDVLALEMTEGEGDGYTKEWNINGEKVTLTVKKM